MGRLSFAIALNLVTDGFKKGVTDVKSGIGSIKSTAMSAAAYFGVGFLGIKTVFDKIRDAGLETSRAISVLKANSGGIIQTGQNLRFVQGIADKYKFELTSLITEYGRFTAAATTAGYSVQQQQSIFEGVQKAIKGYKLNPDAADAAMSALQKMMNSGTISTRNFTNLFLRAMPQAKKALADAMGVGIDKVNALVKKGVSANEVLVKFAKNLQSMSPSVDTTNLGSAKNRISNVFSGLAQDTNMTKWTATITNRVADVLEYIRSNAKSLAYTIGGLLAGIKISQFFNQWKIFSQISSEAMITNATVAHSKVRSLESGTLGLLKQISKLEEQQTTYTAEARLAAEEKLSAAKKQLAEAEVAYSKASAEERLAVEVQLTEAKTQLMKAQITSDKVSADAELATHVQLATKKEQLATNELALTEAKNTARVADERATAVQSGSAWESTWAKIKTGGEALGASLKAVWATVGPMILITLVTELIAKFVELYNRSQQVTNAYKDYKAEANKAVHTREITELESLKQQYNAAKKNSKERFDIEKRIGDLTGQKVTGERSINKLLNDRISLLKTAAAVEFYTNKVLTLQDRQGDLSRKYGGNAPGSKKGEQYWKSHQTVMDQLNPFLGNDYAGDIKEYTANKAILADADKKLAQAELSAAKYTTKEAPYANDNGPGKVKKDPAATQLQNAEQRYADDLMKISLSEKAHLTTADAANEARRKLVVDIYSELATSKYPKVRNSDFTKKMGGQYTQIAANASMTQFNTSTNDLLKKQDELKKQYQISAITQEQYNNGTQDTFLEGKKLLVTYGDMANKGEAYAAALSNFERKIGDLYDNIKQPMPIEAKRDTTFDYKKTKTDVLGEQLDNAKKQYDDLNSDAIKKTAKVVDAINAQLAKVTSLSDALKLAEVQDDIKNLKKELSMGQAWEDFKGVAGTVQDIGSAFQNLSQTMSNADASSWEKILSIWQAIQSSVDGMLNVIDMISRWTKASKELTDAKKAEQVIVAGANAKEAASSTTAAGAAVTQSATQVAASEKAGAAKTAEAGTAVAANATKAASTVASTAISTAATEAETTASEKSGVAKVAEAGATVAANATKTASTVASTAISSAAAGVEAANNQRTVAGNIASAGSEVVKQNSKIPIVGIALAAAGLIAILGLMGKLPKFANGGVIGGGSTSGDNMLARVNSGEMILNGGQQRRLFNIANGNGGGTQQQSIVSTKVRGEDMYLTIKNFMRSKNKKW